MATLTYRGISYQRAEEADSRAAELYPGTYRGVVTTIPTSESIWKNERKQSLMYRGVIYDMGAQLQPAL